MITGAQVRAARALLKWNAEELAQKIGVSRGTIVRIEAVDDIPTGRIRPIMKLRTVLEEAGIEFIDSDEYGGPGVRLAK